MQETPTYQNPKEEQLATLKSNASYLHFRMKRARHNDHLIAADQHEAELEEVQAQIKVLEKELAQED